MLTRVVRSPEELSLGLHGFIDGFRWRNFDRELQSFPWGFPHLNPEVLKIKNKKQDMRFFGKRSC